MGGWLGRLVLLVALGGCEAAAPAPAPDAGNPDGRVARGRRVLFVGNSLTYVNDVPGHYQAIAGAFLPQVSVEEVTAGGYTLAQHAQDARTDGTPLARWLRTVAAERTSFAAGV